MASAVMQAWFALNHAFFVFRSLTTCGLSAWDGSRGVDIGRRVESIAKGRLTFDELEDTSVAVVALLALGPFFPLLLPFPPTK
jgi:hypothetical protein